MNGQLLFKVCSASFLPQDSVERFCGIVELVASSPNSLDTFQHLDNTTAGVASEKQCCFLTTNLPEAGKAEGCKLGVLDPKLGASIKAKLQVPFRHDAVVEEFILGLKAHFPTIKQGSE